MSETFDVGKIEALITADLSPFLAGLDLARRSGDDFARRKFTATLDADITAFEAKRAAVDKALRALAARKVSPLVDADTRLALAKLDDIAARLAVLGGAPATVRAVLSDDVLLTDLDLLDARLAATAATVADPTVTSTTGVATLVVLDDIEARLAGIGRTVVDVPVSAETASFDADAAGIEATKTLIAAPIDIPVRFDVTGLAGVMSSLALLSAASGGGSTTLLPYRAGSGSPGGSMLVPYARSGGYGYSGPGSAYGGGSGGGSSSGGGSYLLPPLGGGGGGYGGYGGYADPPSWYQNRFGGGGGGTTPGGGTSGADTTGTATATAAAGNAVALAHAAHVFMPEILGLGAALLSVAAGFAVLAVASSGALVDIGKGFSAVSGAQNAILAAVPGTTQWAAAVGQLGQAWSTIPAILQPAVSAINKMMQGFGTTPMANELQRFWGAQAQIIGHLFAGGGQVFAPLIMATERAMVTVEGMLSKALGGGGLAHIVGTLSHMVGPALVELVQMAAAIAKIAVGFASAVQAGQGMEALVTLFRALAALVNSSIIQGFITGWVDLDRLFSDAIGTLFRLVGMIGSVTGGMHSIGVAIGFVVSGMVLLKSAAFVLGRMGRDTTAFQGAMSGVLAQTAGVAAFAVGITGLVGEVARLLHVGDPLTSVWHKVAGAIGLVSHSAMGGVNTIAGYTSQLNGTIPVTGNVTAAMDLLVRSEQSVGSSLGGMVAKGFGPLRVSALGAGAAVSTLTDSVQTLISNMLHSNQSVAQWAADAQILIKRGMDPAAVASLAQQAPQDLASMATATTAQLGQMNVQWAEKMMEAKMSGQNGVNAMIAAITAGLTSGTPVTRAAAEALATTLGKTLNVPFTGSVASVQAIGTALNALPASVIATLAGKTSQYSAAANDAAAATKKAAAAAGGLGAQLGTLAMDFGLVAVELVPTVRMLGSLGGLVGRATGSIYLNIAALGEWAAALIGVTVESVALNVALGVGVIGAVALLGMGIYELVSHLGPLKAALILGAVGVTALGVAFIFLDAIPVVALIVAIGLAVVGLVAGIIYLAKNWSSVWGLIRSVSEAVWGALRTAWQATINAIVVAWRAVSGALMTAWRFVWQALVTAYHAVVDPLVGLFKAFSTALVSIANTLKNILDPIFNAMWDVLKFGWSVVRAFLLIGFAVFRDLTIAAWNLIKTVFVDVWNGISSLIHTVWTATSGWVLSAWGTFRGLTASVWNLIKQPIFTVWNDLFGPAGVVRVVWMAVSGWLSAQWASFTTILTRTWNTIKQAVIRVWDALFGPKGIVRTLWADVASWLGHQWQTFMATATGIFGSASGGGIVGAIASAWSGLTGFIHNVWVTIKTNLTKDVNDVIGIINGFISVVDTIGAAVGAGANLIKPIGMLSAGGGGGSPGASASVPAPMAGGGHPVAADGATIGSGFMTKGPTVVVGEGNQAHPEFVIPTDPAYRGNATKLTSALLGHLGTPGLAGGGTLGGIASTVGGVVGGVGGAIAGALGGAIGGSVSALLAPEKALLGGVAGLAPGPLGAIFQAVVNRLFTAAEMFLLGKQAATAGSAGGGGALPTGAHAGLIAEALGIAGQAVTAGNEAAVNTIVSFESSWNPSAINLTDSNARAGHPSQGLMQTIPATFARWAVPPYNRNIDDPLSNLIAGIRYAVATYGGLGNVPGVLAVGAGRGYVGYQSGGTLGSMPFQVLDQGGMLPTGLSAVYNGTGSPEAVPGPGGSSGIPSSSPAVVYQFGAALVAAMIDVKNFGTTVLAAIAGLTTTTTGLTSLDAGLTATTAALTALDTGLAKITTDAATLDTGLNTLATGAGSLNTALGSLGSGAGQVGSSLTSLGSDVTSASSALQAFASALQAAASAASSAASSSSAGIGSGGAGTSISPATTIPALITPAAAASGLSPSAVASAKSSWGGGLPPWITGGAVPAGGIASAPGGSYNGMPLSSLPVGSYDSGGWLPPGLSLAHNGTGAPEQVGNPRGASGGSVTINDHRVLQIVGDVTPQTAAKLRGMITAELDKNTADLIRTLGTL